MFLTWLPVALVLLSLAAPGRSRMFTRVPPELRKTVILDLDAVPCNWCGDADGDWLYMSTSAIHLNRALIMSSNFTNKGNVYEDGISCDPAMFFMSPNGSHLTNVTVYKGIANPESTYFYPSKLDRRISNLPYGLTMLNLTYGRLPTRIPPIRLQFPQLQSLALRRVSKDLRILFSEAETTDLLILDLSYNKMLSLDRNMFEGMYNLTVMLLNGNLFFGIWEYTFCGESLPMLYIVNLVNVLTDLATGIFSSPERDCNIFHECDMANLGLLRFSISDSQSDLGPFAFSRLRGVNELQVSDSRVRRIDDDTFACLAEMRNLFLSDNKIQNLSNRAFSHLYNLQQLLLNNNILNGMSAALFESNPRLVYINASYNMIDTLDGPFALLPQITDLDFSHNRIEGIRNNTFAFCHNLERLYLQYNSLSWIDSGAFVSVNRLHILNLAHNRLSYINKDLFADMSSLSELYMNNNNIARSLSGNLPFQYFQPTERFQILNLARNGLFKVDKDLLTNMSLLRELCLNDNTIRFVEFGAFRSLKRLQVLNLSRNYLVYVWNDLFDDTPLLSELYLNDNGIRHIEDGTFQSVKRLQLLNLSNNLLSNLNEDLFADMSLLRELYLNDNLLQYIEAEIILGRSTILSDLTLAGNPWDCNCDLDALRLWLKECVSITVDLREVTCFRTTTLIDFSDSFCEEQNALLAVVSILTAVLLVLVAGSVTVYKFRLDIQLLLFAKYGFRFPGKHSLDAGDQNRLYDAFVSYNSKDESFVLRDLMPKLEKQSPFYKLCLHFRDFALGAAIAENIIEAIDTSKRTIMLVSKDFLQSDWCQYEFQMAHHQVLSEGGRNRLILVMMEQIDISDITDHTLKSYIRTHTYIEKNHPRFWERLRFALPDKKT